MELYKELIEEPTEQKRLVFDKLVEKGRDTIN